MSASPYSDDAPLTAVMAADDEIESLRVGLGSTDNPALGLLLDLRDDVDRRTADIIGRHDLAAAEAGSDRAPAAPLLPQRHRRSQRLAVLPVAGALVLASTGAAAALSTSPRSPLFPLHRLIFGAPSPSSDSQIARDLQLADGLLGQAAATPFNIRDAALGQARFQLLSARRLLPQASSADARARFAGQITEALARAQRLSVAPAPAAPPTHSTSPGAITPGPEPSEPAESSSGGEIDSSSAPTANGGTETETPAASPPSARQPAPSTEREPATVTDRGWSPTTAGEHEAPQPEPSDT